MRVPYKLPGSTVWRFVNIYTRLNQERILFLNQPLSDGVANSLISAMLYLDSEDQTKPIQLYINSLGDPVDAGITNLAGGMVSILSGLAVYDTMQHIKSEIVTICMGQAVGMATLLLSAGSQGKRVSLPHASIAFNFPRIGTQGQATDIQMTAQEMLAKKALVLDILSQTTGKSVAQLAKDSDRIQYMIPQEAQEYGLIDRVLTSARDLA
ncbi:MAG: ATP-dependent Clp protease proteolytic subunit [Synechococcales bacterium]|nr:ATP-dependent Clp protease proteolytic subunit [Synechococcales bacterium]